MGTQLAVTLMVWWHDLTNRLRQRVGEDDTQRGDSPVPTAVIVAGLVILAVAVVAWATTKANGYMNSAPGNGNPGGGGPNP